MRISSSIFIKSARVACLAALCEILVLLVATPAWCSRLVTDETGRKISLPDHVQKVVSLTPAITDTIYALGGASQLAAITSYTSYPPEAKQKPSVGDILHPSVERIAALHPDVVIALSTLNSPDTIRSLERVGVPVFLLSSQNLAGIYRSIDLIAQVLGRQKEAQSLSTSLRAREQRIRDEAKNNRHPSVLLLLSIDPFITAGHGAFISEMIAETGAQSVTADFKQDWVRMSVEALLPRNPYYLLALMDAPFGIKDLQSRPGWNQLQAVRRGRIIRVDDRLQVPGPVAFDGLEEFARQLREAEAHQ